MLTITGTIAEVAAVQALIEAGAAAKPGEVFLLDRVIGQDNETGAEAMLTFSIQTKAQREAAQREFILSLPGRYEGTIDRWKMGQHYGWTTQHNGLGQAEGGKDLLIPREEIAGVGYDNQPIVGKKITYRRVRSEKGLRAEMVVMIDNPKSVAAFIEWLTKDKEAYDSGKARPKYAPNLNTQGYEFPSPSETRRGPIPTPRAAPTPYQRATPEESKYKGPAVFRPDPAPSTPVVNDWFKEPAELKEFYPKRSPDDADEFP